MIDEEVYVMKRKDIRKMVLLWVFPVFILMGCVCLNKQGSEAESRSNRVDDVISYESVLICRGDTLWSIARENLSNATNAEIQDYVEEIISLNRLSTTSIHTGNYILIPKYEEGQ